MHRQNCKNPGGRSCCLCLAVVGEVSPAGCMAYTCLPATWHVPEPETARSARKIDQRLAGAAGHCQMHVCSTCQRKSASLAAWKRCESQRPTLSVVVLPMQGNAGSACVQCLLFRMVCLRMQLFSYPCRRGRLRACAVACMAQQLQLFHVYMLTLLLCLLNVWQPDLWSRVLSFVASNQLDRAS